MGLTAIVLRTTTLLLNPQVRVEDIAHTVKT